MLLPLLNEDPSFPQNFDSIHARVSIQVEEMGFNRALEVIWDYLDADNKYIAAWAPFSLMKDPANSESVAHIIANLLEAIRVIADALEPFMPVTARRIFSMLNLDPDGEAARAPYGQGLTPGHKVNPPAALFPRIEKSA
jgi:methionyl-tRNA synthetase